jgi:hypothetical protein
MRFRPWVILVGCKIQVLPVVDEFLAKQSSCPVITIRDRFCRSRQAAPASKRGVAAAGDFNPTRFIAGFQRILPLPPILLHQAWTSEPGRLFDYRRKFRANYP